MHGGQGQYSCTPCVADIFFGGKWIVMIEVHINGNSQTVPEASTVRSLLESLGIADREGTAVAVNMEVVPRSAHVATTLHAGDRIEIVQAVGGG
jgi:sulfur carrier protein